MTTTYNMYVFPMESIFTYLVYREVIIRLFIIVIVKWLSIYDIIIVF